LIPAGDSREIWADFSYNGEEAVATAITTPVENTDYEANSQENSGGSDLSGDISITMSKFAKSAKLTIENTGGTDAYMTTLQLRGDAIVADKYTYVERTDTDSIDAFGERQFEVKSDWLQNVNTARDEADILLSRLSHQRQYPRFKVVRGNFDVQFGIRLFGLVQVNFERAGVTGEYRIGYVKHSWTDEIGTVVDTEVYLEPNLSANVSGTWVFPAVFGLTTVF